MHGIDYLLSPLSLHSFREDYHGRKAIHIPGEEEKFSEFFTWEDINHLINYGNLTVPAIRLVHNTENLPPNALNERDKWLAKGATLIMNSVQNLDPLIDEFVNVLSSEMNTSINVNCYASFPEKQGFDIHFDFHDVFIIQLDGSKKWNVYEPTLSYPVESMKKGDKPSDVAELPSYDPYLEVEMTPGDVMYIPRGHWHFALSVTPSIHLTVGPQARSPGHFLHWLTNRAVESDEFFRRDFPIIDHGELGGRVSHDGLTDSIEAFRTKTRKLLDDDGLMDQFVEFIMTNNAMRLHNNTQLPALGSLETSLNEQTVFEFPPGQKALVQFDPDNERASIDVRGSRIGIEQVPVILLKTVFDGRQRICGRDLLDEKTGHDWNDIRQFLLLLYTRNVIRLAAVS